MSYTRNRRRALKHYLAVEIEITRGPIILATAYLPPRPFLPYPDILSLLREQKPVYIMGDLNARHAPLEHGNNNNIGNSIIWISQHPYYPRRHNNKRPSPYHHGDLHQPTKHPITPRADYKNANCDQFKQILNNKPHTELSGKTNGDIDQETERWLKDIIETKQITIPHRTPRALPHTKSSTELQHLQVMYQNVRNLATHRGWDQELKRRCNEIRIQLTEACRALSNSLWAKLTPDLSSQAKVFHISEEENLAFDEETEGMVTQELANSTALDNQNPVIDYSCLDEEDPLISLITAEELRMDTSQRSLKQPSSLSFKSRENPPTDQRPISLLEKPGKNFERIINSRLHQHLELNNLLIPRQFGFRNFKSTSTAIDLAYEEIALGLADNNKVNIVLRDVAKAFDKVWHPERRPTGECISPTLYTLYTTPIPPPERSSNYVMYADDITQIITHPSPRANFIKLATNKAINKINKFEGEWKIKTNS
ncbi:uncharacterized protein [Penaeus vannamei]|uniref:uncharacterized protein n=1 Tax=Penaeus vannamei TaxID=6689 RepID=UPI00387F5107